MSSSEVAALLNPADRPAFNKALWRAAKAFRQKGGRKPEPSAAPVVAGPSPSLVEEAMDAVTS